MLNFRQIKKDEWQEGDFRPTAMIHRPSLDILRNQDVIFEESEEEGVGRVKFARFKTSNNKPFLIIEYLEPQLPITYILTLNNSLIMTNELLSILEALDLSYTELDWVNEDIDIERLSDKQSKHA